MLSICAVMAIRNEVNYLPILLPILAKQGIEVAILDHESTDGSREMCSAYMGNPIVSIRDLKYEGIYSQTQQLAAKQEIYQSIRHDWVIHHDADEILENYRVGYGLRDAIQEAHEGGFNAINFDEFVFLPKPEENFLGKDYYKGILRYYFFEPRKNRLNRAWFRKMSASNVPTGGHILSGNGVSLFPYNHVLRHYIVLGNDHAKQKYLYRRFDREDVEQGWHRNRLNFTEKNLSLPRGNKRLRELSTYDSMIFQKDKPSSTHYWEWKKWLSF